MLLEEPRRTLMILQTKINRYVEKWTGKGYDEKTIGGWVKPLMREAGYGRNTITRVLPEAAKFKPRGKPVSTKIVQNIIATEEQQPYLYPCTQCHKEASSQGSKVCQRTAP